MRICSSLFYFLYRKKDMRENSNNQGDFAALYKIFFFSKVLNSLNLVYNIVLKYSLRYRKKPDAARVCRMLYKRKVQ